MFSVGGADSILRFFDKIGSRRAVSEYCGAGEQDNARTHLLETVLAIMGAELGLHVQPAWLFVRLYVDMAPNKTRHDL